MAFFGGEIMNIAAADERDIVYRRDDKYVKWDRCIVRDKNGKTLWGSCYYRLRRGSALSFSFNEKGGEMVRLIWPQ